MKAEWVALKFATIKTWKGGREQKLRIFILRDYDWNFRIYFLILLLAWFNLGLSWITRRLINIIKKCHTSLMLLSPCQRINYWIFYTIWKEIRTIRDFDAILCVSHILRLSLLSSKEAKFDTFRDFFPSK